MGAHHLCILPGRDLCHGQLLRNCQRAPQQRSAIYADRPDAPMAGWLVGWKNIVSFLHYGEHFKQCRRLIHGLVGTPVSLKKLHHMHEHASHKMLKSILAKPEDLDTLSCSSTSGALLLRVVYGWSEDEHDHPFVQTADQAVNDLYIFFDSSSDSHGSQVHPVRHLPSWLPGTAFKRQAKGWSSTFDAMVDRPSRGSRVSWCTAGNNESSFVADHLREGVEDEFTVKWTAASMSAAGPDTTAWTVFAFFKAMAMYPDVMKRAQAEIESVVGSDRLPQLSDRAQMPFIDAMVLESLRWHPVAPLGFPHRLTEDDHYEGFLLPKGALVQAKRRVTDVGITRDPAIYPNPHVFDPTRFMASETKQVQPNPEYTFGWGRRICPGRLMALEVLFITYAQVLAVYNISKGTENGVPVQPDVGRSEGVVSRPTAFKCDIKPRNKKALSLITDDFPIN
ncbi:cytochrome P450 [Mycena rosella]|uniref:Cytochrome P450 n=1 Tax=Mycena rosella TaxID=1033263 RepID=A0AAD7C3E0_MYCRO|nr:cytochrome P450 [Mycena rosella]